MIALPIDRTRIQQLVPHAGSMCLLDTVVACDDASIECLAHSHRAADHPLRHRQHLSAVHAIEYAAQAAALHGALQVESGTRVAPGMIVALRDCELLCDTLHDLSSPLRILARRLLANSDGLIYGFEVRANEVLARGRLSVKLPTKS